MSSTKKDKKVNFKHKRKEHVSRDEAAQRLIALGQALANGGSLDIGAGGEKHLVAVADDLRWEYDTKAKAEHVEIELELRWQQVAPAVAATEPETAASTTDLPAPTGTPTTEVRVPSAASD
jgi:amphi-Trp domain-containing protein